ncbi:MAG: META domain-containing protein [Muribaculaceae bacterium]|nr:META domain-containing protein [Muribaculaceae bacterium]
MTTNQILILAISGLLGLASCSIFKKSETIVATPTTEKEFEEEEADSVTPTKILPTTISTLADKHIAGEWTIISVFGKKINMEEMPFLNFDISTNKMYGNNGCNVINGYFKTGKNKELEFDQVITSLMACPDVKVETSIMKAINETRSYSYSTIKGIIHLNFLDHRGAAILTLKRHNLDGLNGSWTVKEIDGKRMESDKVRLVIDIQELRIHGNSGCNIINGVIVLDPKKNSAIQFSQIASTRMACPDMKIETALLVALEEVEFFKKKNSNELEFFDNKNQKVLIFKRLPLLK